MAGKAITTSFTVTFSSKDGKDGILIAEVDGRDPAEGGLNTKSSFSPGDSVVYLIFKGPGVTVISQHHSYGTHTPLKSGVEVIQEDQLVFYAPDNLEQSLKYPVSSILSWDWVGTPSVGNVTFNGQTVTATGNGYGVGVLKIRYTAKADAYVLSHAPLGYPDYEIATLVVGNYTAVGP